MADTLNLVTRLTTLVSLAFLLSILPATLGFRYPYFASQAQSPTAALSGTVVDESGAVVTNVRLTAFNLTSVIQRHANTNDQGYFVIPLLQPGKYTLTAQQKGFATVEVRNILLNVNDRIAVRIKLKIGEIGETVTIIEGLEGEQQLSLSSSSTVLDRKFLENLPLNGRSFQSLIQLAPRHRANANKLRGTRAV